MHADESAPEDDDRLMQRVARGDRAAFARLVERHLDRTLAVAQRVCGNRSEAEDVAQDVFERVWIRAAEWQPGRARFSTWLYRVTVNRCLDLKRRPAHAALEAAGDVAGGEPDAFEALADTRRGAEVERAIGELPERQRAALALCYSGGASNAEAAEALGISVGALEGLLVRAKRALRERLPAELW